MIKQLDFYHMRRGFHIKPLNEDDLKLMEPVCYKTKETDSAILLLHGFSSSPAVFRYMIPELKKHYDAVFCPLLPGHGQDINSFSKTNAAEWLKFVEDELRQLTKDYKKVDVLGLSLGGLLACHACPRYQVNHLYLLAPALSTKLRENLVVRFANLLELFGFSQIRNGAGNLKHQEHTEIAYRRLPITVIREILSLIHDYQYHLIPCPIDVFLGTYDMVIDNYKICRLLNQEEHINFHWLKNSAHVLPLDNDVSEILDCIIANCSVKE